MNTDSSFNSERQSALTPDRGRESQQGQDGNAADARTRSGSGVDAPRLVRCSSLDSPDRTRHFRDKLKSHLTGSKANLESRIRGVDLLLGFAENLNEDDARSLLRAINP